MLLKITILSRVHIIFHIIILYIPLYRFSVSQLCTQLHGKLYLMSLKNEHKRRKSPVLGYDMRESELSVCTPHSCPTRMLTYCIVQVLIIFLSLSTFIYLN